MSAKTALQAKIYAKLKANKYSKTGTLKRAVPGNYDVAAGVLAETITEHTVYLVEDVGSGAVKVDPETRGTLKEKQSNEERPIHLAGNGVRPISVDVLNFDGRDWIIKSIKDESAGQEALFLCMVE